MPAFTARYKKLNPEQQRAVDTIDGPLLVIAGPGTGKTELLSMRVANILHKTDTLPSSILCLTFTDSGANAMRQRLSEIIGPDAYKVAIHTFHSFGSEVINQNNQYFYHGANFQPANELNTYEILTSIFDELDYNNPLATKFNGEYTHLGDTIKVISELKQSGLTSDELLGIIAANEAVMDLVEAELSTIFANKPSTSMLSLLVPLAERVAAQPKPNLPAGITPLSNVLALSMAHAFDAAISSNKTTPITAWRNEWLEKDLAGRFVFKNRKRHAKLRALTHIYFAYLSRMEHASLYDYDDMILQVVHGMETQPDLCFNLQEKYQYILVDEFQDTNLAQLRILFNLTSSAAHESRPNVMAVGDDDQAIYSFQGADINNIHRFREQYGDVDIITLKDNYRSTKPIIKHAREIIAQAEGRLETTIDSLDKTLTAHVADETSRVKLYELSSPTEERAWLAQTIQQKISEGTAPEQIAILARKHSELVSLLPYLNQRGIKVNYERRDNVLDMPVVCAIELLANIIIALYHRRHDLVDSLMPQLLAHPAFGISPESIWRLSIKSYRSHLTWLEVMATTPDFVPIHSWLIAMIPKVPTEPIESMIDILIGTPTKQPGADIEGYVSPLYNYYFSSENMAKHPDAYLQMLEALRTIRTKLREYTAVEDAHIEGFLKFMQAHRQMGSSITSIRRRSDELRDAINLMTAHKAKGLEFDAVYIVGGVDTSWGERVRSRSRLINYPENIQLAPSGNNYHERLRLFFVAMTRAKRQLTISYSAHDSAGKDMLPASFLIGTSLKPSVVPAPDSIEQLTEDTEQSWREIVSEQPTASMRELLSPLLEQYKLSITHLNNFIDITRGGPITFLLNNLLRFPQAKSASAGYGTAIHAILQRAHMHFAATGERRPIEDVLGDFDTELKKQGLTNDEYKLYSKKGNDSLIKFLTEMYPTFTSTQKTELNFSNQSSVVGEAKLTGSLDLVDINDKTIVVTDYKTGAPASDWKGKADYEKVKLHKYRQQLMFYQLLVEQSRDYSKYQFGKGVLQFVEPDRGGQLRSLEATFSADEMADFKRLVCAVWRCITTLELPAIDKFEPNYKGVLAFEKYLIDEYTEKG